MEGRQDGFQEPRGPYRDTSIAQNARLEVAEKTLAAAEQLARLLVQR